MAPLLATLLVAVGSAAAAYLLVTFRHRRTEREDSVTVVAGNGRPVSLRTRVPSLVGAFAALVVAGVVLGDLATRIEQNTAVVHWDDQLERWAAASAGTLSTAVLRAITQLGDTVVVLGVTLIAGLVLLKVGRRRLALYLATVFVGQWALANLVKVLVARARPALDPLTAFSGYSFPSGHAVAAAATYLAVALVLVSVRPSWNGPLLVAVGVGVAAAVATSRAMLGVHWFSDVLGGLLLGWAWCLVCARLFRVSRAATQEKVVVA